MTRGLIPQTERSNERFCLGGDGWGLHSLNPFVGEYFMRTVPAHLAQLCCQPALREAPAAAYQSEWFSLAHSKGLRL
jgi:hypothetical protein